MFSVESGRRKGCFLPLEAIAWYCEMFSHDRGHVQWFQRLRRSKLLRHLALMLSLLGTHLKARYLRWRFCAGREISGFQGTFKYEIPKVLKGLSCSVTKLDLPLPPTPSIKQWIGGQKHSILESSDLSCGYVQTFRVEAVVHQRPGPSCIFADLWGWNFPENFPI